MPTIADIIQSDVYIKRKGQLIPLFYFDNGGDESDPPEESLITNLNFVDWQGLYVAEGTEYNELTGVWNDNGIENKNTVLIAGSAPTLNSSWLNGKQSVVFNGGNSLQIALQGDNYSTLNIPQSFFLVGEYTDTGLQKFLEAGLFELDNISNGLPTCYNGVAGVEPFIIRENYQNRPFALGLYAYNDKVLNYYEGDYFLTLGFSSQEFRTVLMGNQMLTGNIGMLGITEDVQPGAEFNRTINTIHDYYNFDYSNDNKLCFIGDSLTAGATIADKTDYWTYNLILDLQTQHSETFRYLNTSESGIKVTNYDPFPFDDLLGFTNGTDINDRVLFIWLGSNDFAPFEGEAVNSTEMLDNMIKFITDRIKSGYKKIAVGTVINRIEFQNDPSLNTEVLNYNSLIKAYDFTTLETNYGCSIQIVPLDEQTELQDATNLTYFDEDEVHINAAGAAIVKTQMQSVYNTLRGVTVPVDTTSPTILSTELPNNNSYIDLEFSKGVFSNNSGTNIVGLSNFNIVNFVSGGVTAISINSIDAIDTPTIVGNEKRIRLNISLTGTPDGTETFNISTSSVFDIFGNQIITDSPLITLNSRNEDLQAVLDAASLAGETIPSETDINNLDILIKELDSIGAWANIDRMLVYCSDGDEDYNLRQYKNPNVSAINNGASYVPGEGFDGTTTSSNYIDTNIRIDLLTNYNLLNASFILYQRENNVNACELGVRDATLFNQMLPNRTTTNSTVINNSTPSNFPSSNLINTGTNHFNLKDIGGGQSELEIYVDGVLFDSVTVTPGGIPVGFNLYEFGRNNQGTQDLGSSNQHSLLIIGGDLSPYALEIHNAINTYMTAQGINV